jgi:hypothetical protein
MARPVRADKGNLGPMASPALSVLRAHLELRAHKERLVLEVSKVPRERPVNQASRGRRVHRATRVNRANPV